MRSFFQICLVTGVQIISCVIAGYGLAETLLVGSFVLVWQALFILIIMKIRSKGSAIGNIRYSNVCWFLTFPVSAVFSPVMAIAAFIGGTVWDLNKISGSFRLTDCIERDKVGSATSICCDSETPSFDRINYNSENNYPMGWKF